MPNAFLWGHSNSYTQKHSMRFYLPPSFVNNMLPDFCSLLIYEWIMVYFALTWVSLIMSKVEQLLYVLKLFTWILVSKCYSPLKEISTPWIKGWFPGQGKTSLEHLVVSELKKCLTDKQKSEQPTGIGDCQRVAGANWKSSQWPNLELYEQQAKCSIGLHLQFSVHLKLFLDKMFNFEKLLYFFF